MNLISSQTLTDCFSSVDSQLVAEGFTVHDSSLRNSNMLESIGALIIFPQKIVSLDGAHYMTGRNEQTGVRSLSK